MSQLTPRSHRPRAGPRRPPRPSTTSCSARSSPGSRRTQRPIPSRSSPNCSSPSARPSVAAPGSPSRRPATTPTSSCCLCGDSSKARKGSSWDHVRRLIAQVDPAIERRILTGLSSGEGLIWAVRDPTAQDPGITDQRLLVIEPEFASVLKASAREISTLSPTLRSAWDGRPLAILTRTAPARATSAHIALIGHITQHELRRHTSTIELANGYLNRILIIACRRQRLLPEGGHHDPLARHRPHRPARRDPQARPNRWRDPSGPRRTRALAPRLPAARPTPTRRARPDHRPR